MADEVKDPRVEAIKECSVAYAKASLAMVMLMNMAHSMIKYHGDIGEGLLRLINSMPDDVKKQIEKLELGQGSQAGKSVDEIISEILDEDNGKGENK